MNREAAIQFYRSSRQWEAARHQKTMVKDSTYPFRVLTFNVLAQGSIKREQYTYCAHDTLKWWYRREKLIAEIQAYEADLGFFQEMDHYDGFFRKEFESLGYQSIYARKKENNPQGDGLCIIYRPQIFEIQNFRVQSLEETMRHLPEATPNISLFAHFKDLRTDQRLIVVSCHLYWNWDFDHLRAVQAHYMFVQLFEWIQSIGLSEDSVQIICCGDFNSDPTSVAYRMITGRAMRTSHYHKVMERAKLEEFKLRDLLHFFHQKSGRFRSAYSMQQFRPGKELGAYSEPSWTNHVNKFRGKIRKATAVN